MDTSVHPRALSQSLMLSAVAGGFAGVATDLIYFPIDTLKTRIMASSSKMNFEDRTKNISKFKGLTACMLQSFPYAFSFFIAYDYSK